MSTQISISEPSILTANTYFYHPDSTANGRRRSERQKHEQVRNYLEKLGFDACTEGDYTNAVGEFEKIGTVKVSFNYSESCKNVYKRLEVTRNGKQSNITLLRKIANS